MEKLFSEAKEVVSYGICGFAVNKCQAGNDWIFLGFILLDPSDFAFSFKTRRMKLFIKRKGNYLVHIN